MGEYVCPACVGFLALALVLYAAVLLAAAPPAPAACAACRANPSDGLSRHGRPFCRDCAAEWHIPLRVPAPAGHDDCDPDCRCGCRPAPDDTPLPE